MTLRFIETSILESSDGLNFEVETRLDSEETRKAKAEADRASNKPLYQQLAEKKAREKEEHEEKFAKFLAPRQGLDA